MKKIIMLFVALLCGGVCGYSADDPFATYLLSVAEPLRTISVEEQDGISIKSFVYSSRAGLNEVYAILAEPTGPIELDGGAVSAGGDRAEKSPWSGRKYPAVLFLHGGGSNAEELKGHLLRYAHAGYVAMAIDQPGLCGTAKTPYSTGPWKSRDGGEGPRLDVRGGAQNSTMTDAGVAGIEAVNYLAAHPKVDPARVGITGWSWGGYSTTMLSGLSGDKIRAAYAVFGCGFWDRGSFWTDKIDALPENERDVWLKYLDSGRRADGITGAYFIEAPTGDTFFWPPAVSATLDEIRSKKNHAWAANLNHKQLPSGADMQMRWFDYHLKGEGKPFCEVGPARVRNLADNRRYFAADSCESDADLRDLNADIRGKKTSGEKFAGFGGRVSITCKVDIPAGITVESATLYYSDARKRWVDREWTSVDMAVSSSGKKLEVVLPIGHVLANTNAAGIDNLNWFISVKDSRGVIVSGEMRGYL